MKPELRHVGASRSPVVVIDEFSGDIERVQAIAEALAPFPRISGQNYYPGVRRIIGPSDRDANAYVERTCEQAAQFVAGAFDIGEFNLREASFSMVTLKPRHLHPAQRAPHFDTTNPNHLALLHYLRVPAGTGTAFYRQRSTGIEVVTDANVAQFVQTAATEAAQLAPDSGYIHGSDDFFEQIGAIDAILDRLIIYRGSLLHSGIIPKGMNFSANPNEGRLTANIFVQGY